MPWVKARLRGQVVFARANADGSFAAVGGRVEVRYKPNDGRAYQAGVGNLAREAGSGVLPDETCGEATAPPPKDGAGGAAKKKGGARASSPKKDGNHHAPTAPPDGGWIAYADGACSGNPGPCGLGVVIRGPSGATGEGYEYLGTGTNNVAELTAILRACEWIPKGGATLDIYTDSSYAIGVLQKGWKAKANQELVEKVKKAIAGRSPKPKLHYVPGHAGVALNEIADELARTAVETRGSRAAKLPDGE